MSRFVLTAQLQLQAPNNVAQVVRQIQSQLNGVQVNVQVQGSQRAQRQIQQLTTQTNQATTAAERMGKAFAISVRRFAAFSIATRAVGLFTSTLSDAIQTAIDFERQLIRVSQVTGESMSRLKGLTSTITELATGMGVASNDLLNVSTLLLQAGVSSKETTVALKTLAKAALAPNFDSLSETTEGAIAILAQFQEGVGSLEKQLGSINAVAGAFAVEAGDLIDVIRRTGGVFKSSGGNLNELLALFTSVRATTRESAESIGTGLRTIFTRIQRPKTIEFLKQFGIELVDLEGKFVGPFEAVRRLSGALSGLGEGDITFIRIAEELGGFRQIGKVLPLLQQFSTAQAALNVANKAGNSLTQDAATAQAALAIRIVKVKEEFLALARSVTETQTFQVFANTSLQLASALIKVADSIKPLLPLLGALAAVKIAKGFGQFAGGILGGLGSARTFNKGGKVHYFARGGMVPGTGNRDTVPAMLQPGEFVIRKSSVEKLGASNLAAMNQNRYALGGTVGGIALTPSDTSYTGSGKVSIQDIIKSLISNSNLPGGIAGNKRVFEGKQSSKQAQQIISQLGGFSGSSPASSRTFQAKGQSFKDADLNKKIGDDVELGMKSLISNAALALGSSISVPVTGSPNSALIKSIGSADVLGKIFEGALNLLGAPFDPLAAKQDRDTFDFPSGLGASLGSYFKGFENIPVDAKKNITPEILNDIATRKTKNLLAGQVNISPQFQALKKTKQLSSGGPSGTDTVPALLTPGEFVVNRKSAQSIGYGALNRMNKIGKYAKGGVVQKFATGTTGTGAQSVVSNFAVPGFDTKAPTALNKIVAKLVGTFSIVDITLQQGAKQLDVLKQITPSLAKSLNNYANAANLTSKQTAQLSGAYANVISQMLKQGASDQEIQKRMQPYIAALDADTQAKLNSAKASAASTVSNVSSTSTQQQSNPFATMGGTMGKQASSTVQQNTQSIIQNTNAQKSATQSALQVANNNKILAASIVSSLIQGFLPAVDENSSTLLVFSQQLLSSIVVLSAVSAGLEAFGLSLSKDAIASAINGTISAFENLKTNGILNTISSLFSQTAATSAQTAAVSANTSAILANTSAQASQASTGQKFAGSLQAGLIAATLVTTGFYTLFGALKEASRLEKERAIKLGDVKGAGEAAASEAGSGVRQTFSTFGSAIGGTLGAIAGAFGGSIIPGAGTVTAGAVGGAAGAAAGGGVGLLAADLFGFSQAAADAAKLQAEVSAMTVSTNKAMAESSKKASEAMDDFSKGTVSAKDALDATDSGTSSVLDLAKRVQQTNVAAENNANNKFFRSSAQKKAQQEGQIRLQDVQKAAQEQLTTIMPALQASMRTTAMQGGDFDDFISSLSTAQFELLNLADGGIQNAYKSFLNLQKEVDRTNAFLQATNLGLRGAEATSTAMSATMDRFVAGFEVGGSTFVANTEFLSQAVTSAAQAMDPSDIKSAVSDVSKNLSQMGISPQFVKKFEGNTNALVQAQQNYGAAFDQIVSEAKSKGIIPNADQLKDQFANSIGNLLGPDVSEDAKNNLKAIIQNIDLSPEEVNKIMAGNYEDFGKKLGEAGQKQFEQIMKIAQERQKAEQVIINLTQQRIEAERNLVQAQQEALDLYLEGREVQAGAGGRAVSESERLGNILGRSNAQGDRLGLSSLRTGGVEELRRRNLEITAGAASFEQRARTDGGLQGASGVSAAEAQKDLQQAYKTQVDTIRSLIKLEQEELKIIQEKNKLEKDSLESLIKGDIEKFFEQQAAVGATAAIATGNQDIISAFGADAIGAAFENIQRQQQAGVQSLFGMSLAGPGGLVEAGASAALSSRGVTDPAAARVLSGTTPEEEARKARIRELGGVLSETGQVAVDMAQMDLNTAEIRVTQANIKLDEINQRGQAAAAQMSRGGTVYASNGIFVPKGTDTVPAMLTPGEFVVNRNAVNRGNNLKILQAMNRGSSVSASTVQGYKKGGKVNYLANGGMASGPVSSPISIDPKVVSDLSNALNNFNSQLRENISALQNTKFQIKLDATSINVNLNGGSFLQNLTQSLKQELIQQVGKEISSYKVGPGGQLQKSSSVL